MPVSYNREMSVYHAIYQRRTAWKFKDEPVSRSAIERMLDAAVWVPNHRMTEPWRFFVSEKGSEMRLNIGKLAYDTTFERTGDEKRSINSYEKIIGPPYLICLYAIPGEDEVSTQENYASVCCAGQNISLAGTAEGLSVAWDTGGACRNPNLKQVLGADEDWIMVTMLLIGVPGERPSSRRNPVSKWVEWSALESEKLTM
ncbi:MAG: hypothetical protein CL759_00010 [Chloroflexi bacterium]|nr:hypothetical protein [Chloroflexota bacterium]|tara:strand:- start:401 stop:1000 length:600 start_codon:yes stop_codon:yes gene_type:complete